MYALNTVKKVVAVGGERSMISSISSTSFYVSPASAEDADVLTLDNVVSRVLRFEVLFAACRRGEDSGDARVGRNMGIFFPP